MTNDWHDINSADARRRPIRVMQVIFAGAATIATLALFSAARPGDTQAVVASQLPQSAQNVAGGSVVAVDDNGGVNDNGQTSGDIFTQNAQDQSTA
ncbi:MAG: hypothetical protein ACLP4W_27600 [Mycobacterium sp.]|uniref:hypothetical protein n=1 Tax=Mycobacterium sp. TaxID=1785 RepID=UPI003F9880A6